MSLSFIHHSEDPGWWAAELGVSLEAVELLLSSHFVDLHCVTEVPVRLIGYDPDVHHGISTFPRPLIGHTDFPRLLEAGLTGVVYDITTNPFRPAPDRLRVTRANIEACQEKIQKHPEHLQLVTSASEYEQAHRDGKLGLWLSLQGGNALSSDLRSLDGPVGQALHRITLVHLTTSDLGGTSSPSGPDIGLTKKGAEFVERCVANRVIVDLAHAGERTFWQALHAHTESVPVIVSHTGVDGVRKHWRNLDDEQIRAIAQTGGVVGIIYHGAFLSPGFWPCKRSAIVDHLEYICELVGEDFAAIGTDYDGFIWPPRDLSDVTHHPMLVQDMLDRGWSTQRIRKILGENYLRVVKKVRP